MHKLGHLPNDECQSIYFQKKMLLWKVIIFNTIKTQMIQEREIVTKCISKRLAPETTVGTVAVPVWKIVICKQRTPDPQIGKIPNMKYVMYLI